MKTQIAYALIASSQGTYLQEIWASVYSLRIYEPDRRVIVCCDSSTASYIKQFHDFVKLIDDICIVPTPEHYSPKERSRAIKTSIRQYITGNYLFVDTDTIFAGEIGYIDNLSCDIAAVPEFHVTLADSILRDSVINSVKSIFGINVSKAPYWFNSGVMYVADTPISHSLYKLWNDNWLFSAFEKGNSQDQPSLLKTDMEMGFVIKVLPGEYNCQLALSVKHYADAKIIHYLHFHLLPMPNNPFYDKSIYRVIKEHGGITDEVAHIIKNCKSAIPETSAIIDGDAVNFLMSNPGHVFLRVSNMGGWPLSIMNKIAGLYARWFKFAETHKK